MDDKNKPDNLPAADTPPAERNVTSHGSSDGTVPYPFGADTDTTSRDDTAGSSTTTAVSKKRKQRLLIALITVALVILGLALAYVYWYQNPNKVVSDAFVHALNAKTVTYTGTLTTAGSSKMVVTMNGGAGMDGGTVNAKLSYEVSGRKYTLDGNGIIDKKNDLYFKVQNIDGLVNNYRRAIPPQSQGLFDQIIDKIDDKWVKISSEDLKSYNPGLVKTQECVGDAVREMQNDATVRAELLDTYKKHPFIAIDKTLGAKDGSLGYALKTDEATSKAFNTEFKKTAFYKSLVKCDSSFADKEGNQLKDQANTLEKGVTNEVWIDRWSHRVTKVAFKQDKSGQTTNISVEPKFNRPVAIVTPKETTTVEQLQKDIQALLQSGQSAPAANATQP